MYARYESMILDETFKIYITDVFYLQGQGKFFNERWVDLAYNNKQVDSRTADEIAFDVMESAGLSFG